MTFDFIRIGCCLALLLYYCCEATKNGRQGDDGCRATSHDPYTLFGTRTAYPIVRNHQLDKPQLADCVPKQLWLVARHGARYPDKQQIHLINTRGRELWDLVVAKYDQGLGQMCKEDVDLLRNEWPPLDLDPSMEYELTPQGWADMETLASAWKERLPSLLDQQYDQNDFTFKHTEAKRAEDSAKAFASGLFGPKVNVTMPKPPNPDLLLRFDKACDKWNQEVASNNDTFIQWYLFRQTDTFKQMVSNVNARLGFTQLTYEDDISLIYLMCGLEKTWRPDSLSAWCSAFSTEDLQVLEYAEDIQLWHMNGYAHEITQQMPCKLVSDLLQNFISIDNGATEAPNGIFYFTHTPPVQAFAASLGLNYDENALNHNNYQDMGARKWHNSMTTPMSANLAFLLWECEGFAKHTYRVGIFQQEHPLDVPECSGPCDLPYFVERVAHLLEMCDFDQLCQAGK